MHETVDLVVGKVERTVELLFSAISDSNHPSDWCCHAAIRLAHL
jgi:hypothetical protein